LGFPLPFPPPPVERGFFPFPPLFPPVSRGFQLQKRMGYPPHLFLPTAVVYLSPFFFANSLFVMRRTLPINIFLSLLARTPFWSGPVNNISTPCLRPFPHQTPPRDCPLGSRVLRGSHRETPPIPSPSSGVTPNRVFFFFLFFWPKVYC